MKKGERIQTTGKGRTARWGKDQGTITRVTKGSVFVRWDGTHFEDEMEPEEVERIEKS